jgi:undecaprenyl diphosphate synthase
MDGNGRWAKSKSLPAIAGHKAGAEVAQQITEAAVDEGIKYLTLYTFSSENWFREQKWIDDLFGLLRWYLKNEIENLHKKNIRLKTIGDKNRLPEDVQKLITDAVDKTKDNTSLTVILALSYGSRDEIIRATSRIIDDARQGKIVHFDERIFESYLDTAGIPDPELLIRTSGEQRLSNYLLYQLAYAEFAFVDAFWPDFTPELFKATLNDFTQRQRRFGR